MITVQEIFATKILRIQGVSGFILIQNDGQILASKTDMSVKPQTLAAMMILSGRDCSTLRTIMGFSRYHYLMISRGKKEKFYIFPIKDHLLGVMHGYPDHDPIFAKKIRQFIRDVFPVNGNGPSTLPAGKPQYCEN